MDEQLKPRGYWRHWLALMGTSVKRHATAETLFGLAAGLFGGISAIFVLKWAGYLAAACGLLGGGYVVCLAANNLSVAKSRARGDILRLQFAAKRLQRGSEQKERLDDDHSTTTHSAQPHAVDERVAESPQPQSLEDHLLWARSRFDRLAVIADNRSYFYDRQGTDAEFGEWKDAVTQLISLCFLPSVARKLTIEFEKFATPSIIYQDGKPGALYTMAYRLGRDWLEQKRQELSPEWMRLG